MSTVESKDLPKSERCLRCGGARRIYCLHCLREAWYTEGGKERVKQDPQASIEALLIDESLRAETSKLLSEVLGRPVDLNVRKEGAE